MLLGQKSPGECITFDKSRPSILHIIPRDGSEAQQVEMPPHFLFHFANAYEDGDKLIVDFAKSDELELGASMAGKEGPIWNHVDYEKDVPLTRLYRYSFSKRGASWQLDGTEALSQYSIEFPSVNPAVSCRKHRYIYASRGWSDEVSSPLQGLLKIDTEAKTEESWIGEPHEFLGENIFVPRSTGQKAEDDGYIISTLHDCKDMKSFLLIFDAQKVGAGPVAKLALPVFIPFGLHGTFANGFTPNFDDITRRFKATKALDTKSWNEVNSGFSGLGISYDF